MNKPQVDTIMAAISRLSDCLVSAHPESPRTGTVPDMMNAAAAEIERLLWENVDLRALYERERANGRDTAWLVSQTNKRSLDWKNATKGRRGGLRSLQQENKDLRDMLDQLCKKYGIALVPGDAIEKQRTPS